MNLKNDFIKEVGKMIKRKGIDDLMTYIGLTDFYTAPASTMYHDSEEGGLALHSLSVHDVAKELNDTFSLDLNKESIAICALFHDLCKINMYVRGTRNKKNEKGNWEVIKCGKSKMNFLSVMEKNLYSS